MPLKLFLPGLLILAIFCVGCDESDDAGEILGTRNWTSTADGVPKIVFNAGEDIQFCVAFENYSDKPVMWTSSNSCQVIFMISGVDNTFSDIIPRTYNPHPEDGMIPPGGSLEITLLWIEQYHNNPIPIGIYRVNVWMQLTFIDVDSPDIMDHFFTVK